MQNVAYVLNRILGPFFVGFLIASVTASSSLLLTTFLLAMAGICAFFSLPRKDRLIARILR